MEEEERRPEPTWMYRHGSEPQLFQHPDDVPEGEGWEDSPAKCLAPKAVAEKPVAEAPVDEEPEPVIEPPPVKRRPGRPRKNA